jgi:hypothetical protein
MANLREMEQRMGMITRRNNKKISILDVGLFVCEV